MSTSRRRLRSHRLGAVALATAAAALVAAGCGGDGDSGSGSSDEPVRIGISLPLTGEFSQPGKAARQGYELWAETVNEQGGLLGRPVELVIKDDASDQNTVVSDYNALISRDDVDLVLGTFSSLLNLPASSVAERNRMLYVEPAGGAPEMFNRGFRYGPFFTQQAVSDHQGDLFVEWVESLPESKRPKTAAYPTIDDPFAIPVIDAIKAKLEAAGVETVYEDTYPVTTSNFDAIASEIKSANPDLVAHGAVFDDGVGFIRALQKVGFQPEILFETSAPSHGEQYAQAVGPENTDAIFYAVSHTPEAATPGNEEFVAAFEEKFGGEPAEDAADAYASGQVLQAAVEGVGEIPADDQIALADWLRENPVETILGPLEWEETGAPVGEFLIGQWQDGTAEIVLPEEAATTDAIVEQRPGSS